MIRAAFLRRMALVALGSLLFEVRVPEVESEPEFAAMSGYDGTEYFMREYARLWASRPDRVLRGIAG